jgi:hypothetical protein
MRTCICKARFELKECCGVYEPHQGARIHRAGFSDFGLVAKLD